MKKLPQYVIYPDEMVTERWRWRLVDGADNVIAQSWRLFETKAHALANINSVSRAAERVRNVYAEV